MIVHRPWADPGPFTRDEGDTELSPRLIALVWLATILGCWAVVLGGVLFIRAFAS